MANTSIIQEITNDLTALTDEAVAQAIQRLESESYAYTPGASGIQPPVTTSNILTVAKLPPAANSLGMRAFVTDISPLAASFGHIVVGGGTQKWPVFCDGTYWKVG
jgi:hypothetical protein